MNDNYLHLVERQDLRGGLIPGRSNVRTGSGAHPASYTVGTGGSLPEGKAVGT
jgi:hypothetical protein